jgi:hypothetical protein
MKGGSNVIVAPAMGELFSACVTRPASIGFGSCAWMRTAESNDIAKAGMNREDKAMCPPACVNFEQSVIHSREL